jgi:hypothetical protein
MTHTEMDLIVRLEVWKSYQTISVAVAGLQWYTCNLVSRLRVSLLLPRFLPVAFLFRLFRQASLIG